MDQGGSIHRFADTYARNSGLRYCSPYSSIQRIFSQVVRISPKAASSTTPRKCISDEQTNQNDLRTCLSSVSTADLSNSFLVVEGPVQQAAKHPSSLCVGCFSPLLGGSFRITDEISHVVRRGRWECRYPVAVRRVVCRDSVRSIGVDVGFLEHLARPCWAAQTQTQSQSARALSVCSAVRDGAHSASAGFSQLKDTVRSLAVNKKYCTTLATSKAASAVMRWKRYASNSRSTSWRFIVRGRQAGRRARSRASIDHALLPLLLYVATVLIAKSAHHERLRDFCWFFCFGFLL